MSNKGKILVIGGAGFIGANSADFFRKQGYEIVIFDNLSRKGTDLNLHWLQSEGELTFVKGDIRNYNDLTKVFSEQKNLTGVIHLAGQVAVTTSVTNPREDFDINALGTFNVLEAVRNSGQNPVLIYASTNKVYGGMEDVVIAEDETRHYYRDFPEGIPEGRILDFHSPYGCSKGAGDQYVRDYARIYGLRTVVARQSCIYGYRQFGIEDQGWVAWFVIAAVLGKPIKIFGDGKQVRDVLFIEDLVRAYQLFIEKGDKSAGKVYNVGGGSKFTLAIWTQFHPILEELLGRKVETSRGDWRPGDQKVYISDIGLIKSELGWKPKISPKEGITKLYNWVVANREMLEPIFE